MFMNTNSARQQMVDQQVRTWEVLDARVLDMLASVPREIFVPPAYHDLAFADASIPIGHGQSMLPPKIHGRILQILNIAPTDKILEIGTGTGYLTACLSLLGSQITSIEIHGALSSAAAANLRSVHGCSAQLQVRDAFGGEPLGEYDAIAVTGSMPIRDERFEKALRVGGRLFEVVGDAPLMEARLVRRVDADQWIRESIFETVIDPLLNAPQTTRFVF
jgi:protein-L-isoaspartate(D-aspartate) O-methyltransferase